MKELLIKLGLIQIELKAPKSQYNNFGKYKYRNCEDIQEAAKPLLAREGLILTLNDSIEMIGIRYYVKATASITDGENVFSVNSFAREEESKKGMDGSQVTGASSSYARKYALNGLFLIDDTKDADHNNDGKAEEEEAKRLAEEAAKKAADEAKKPKAITEKQMATGLERLTKGENILDKLLSSYALTEEQKETFLSAARNANRSPEYKNPEKATA